VASTLLDLPGVTARDDRTAAISGRLTDVYRQFRVWMTVATALPTSRRAAELSVSG
jgi:D-amino peptidase